MTRFALELYKVSLLKHWTFQPKFIMGQTQRQVLIIAIRFIEPEQVWGGGLPVW